MPQDEDPAEDAFELSEGDDCLPDDVQAEVELGWGFSGGLDSAFDDD
jgi:hypothetical protein